MKKLIPILVVGVLALSGLGAVALDSDIEKLDLETRDYEKPSSSTSPRDYTHTVLVEVGTRTTCPACPASNLAWHSIYDGGNYNFEYTELVYDKNSVANARFREFNPMWVPTSYWDGGEYVYPGTSTGTFYSYLDDSGSRVVPDLVADLDVVWLGSAEIEISYSIQNNDASNYPGRLRIYVIELESMFWNDYNGNPYYHAFLDFAANQVIDISSGGSISDTIVWDGASAGYPSITADNIQVILAVFDDEAHTSYSDPPSGNPFSAYYSDECIAAIPAGGENSPPETPEIDGPTSGKAGVEYNYTLSSTDPDGDDVFYCVDWGDDAGEVCMGPYASGEEVIVSHIWTEQDTYTIKVKAKDIYNAESDWATLEVSMPMNKPFNFNFNLIEWLFERFPNAFPMIRYLLGM